MFWEARWIFSASTGRMLPEHRSILGADGRTRTAHLLITSDNSRVAGACTGLQIPRIQASLLSLPCSVLHRIAFPVVSEWCQEAVDYASPIPLQARYAVKNEGEYSAAPSALRRVPRRSPQDTTFV